MSNMKKRPGKGRKILKKVLACLLVVAVLLVGISFLLRIEDVVVQGSTRYSEHDIIETSGIELGSGMYTFDKFDSIDAIKGKYPYIESVTISRDLPSTVVITVEESVPVAVIKSGGDYWLIDSEAKLLDRVDSETAKGYINIVGIKLIEPKLSETAVVNTEYELNLKQLKLVLSQVEKLEMLDSITAIDVTVVSDITIRYQNRITLKLDDGSDAEYRINYFKKILSEIDEEARGTVYFTEAKTARFSLD